MTKEEIKEKNFYKESDEILTKMKSEGKFGFCLKADTTENEKTYLNTGFHRGYKEGALSDTARKHWEPKWIAVSERLPELTEQVYWYNDDDKRVPWKGKFEKHVLGYDAEKGIVKVHFDGKRFAEVSSISFSSCIKITHWMELPTFQL